MKKYRVPLSYNTMDIEATSNVLHQYKDLSHPELIEEFENQFAALCGSKHVVSSNSGTGALHLALRVLGVGPGDYVIVSTFTYVASVSPILYCGAIPVFVDSEERTWNMDPALLENALSLLRGEGKKVKAVVVVHAYGMPAQMESILAIAKKYDVPVIEDAAEALGSSLYEQSLGTWGLLGVFSFNNNKTITTFGGGMLVSSDAGLVEKARYLAGHARSDYPYYEHVELGYNYLMGPLNAAYGLAQLSQYRNLIQERRQCAYEYHRTLKGAFDFQEELKGARSSFWLTTVRNKNIDPAKLIHSLENQGVELRRVWKPMHRQPLFLRNASFLSGVADALFAESVCLPSGRLEDKVFQLVVGGLQPH